MGGKVAQGVGAQSAANAAKTAASQAIGFDKGVYSDAQQNLNPYITSGTGATRELSGLLNTGGDPVAARQAFDTFRNSTNYDFLLDQGQKSVATANAPSLNSGATGKALINYGQGMAGNALGAYEGMLQGQSSLGAQSALGLGTLGNQTATNIGNALGFGADAQGKANVSGGNAISGALGDIFQGISQGRTQSSFGGGASTSGGASGLVNQAAFWGG